MLVIFVIYHGLNQLAKPLLPAKVLTLVGIVTGLPNHLAQQVTFDFKTDNHGLIRVTWFGLHPHLQPGTKWSLLVHILPISGLGNPGEFSTKQWLLREGYQGYGTVVGGTHNHYLSQSFWTAPISLLRARLQQRLQVLLTGKAELPLVLALILGDRHLLTPRDWYWFQTTGTNHLVAIAGLHMGLIFLISGLCLSGLWRVAFGWQQQVMPQTVAMFGGFACAVFYAFLAGLTIPTQRALVMMAVGVWLWQTRLRYPGGFAWLVALLLVCFWGPLVLMGVSFWLSFGAVGILIYTLSGRYRLQRSHQWLKPQYVMFLGLLPWTVWFFHQFSMVSVLANVIVIPWISVTVMPFLLLAVFFLWWPSLAKIFFAIVCWGLRLQMDYLAWLSHFSWSNAYLGEPSWPLLLLALVGIVLFLAPVALPGRWLGLLGLVPLWLPATMPSYGQVQMTALAVKKGIVVVLKTATHVLVFDWGAKQTRQTSLRNKIIAPYLTYQGERQVSLWVVARPIASAQYNRDVQWQGITVIKHVGGAGDVACTALPDWAWDGVHFHWVRQALGFVLKPRGACNLSIITPSGQQLLLLGAKQWGQPVQASVPKSLVVVSREDLFQSFMGHFAAEHLLWILPSLSQQVIPRKIQLRQTQKCGAINIWLSASLVSAGQKC